MYPVAVFQQTLEKVATILRQHQIRFHLTGGVTSVAYGEPRMTQDIDLVVDPIPLRPVLTNVCSQLQSAGFMVELEAMRAAVDKAEMFQVYDLAEALKLDLYARELIPGELDRSVKVEVFPGLILPIVARADAAASKLLWISKGSHKSRRDLRQIYRHCNDSTRQGIQELASQLNLAALLQEVLNEPDEIA